MRKDEFVSGNIVMKEKIWENEGDLGNVELKKTFGGTGKQVDVFQGNNGTGTPHGMVSTSGCIKDVHCLSSRVCTSLYNGGLGEFRRIK